MRALPIIAFAAVLILVSLALPFFAAGTMPRAADWLLRLSGVLIAMGVCVFCAPLIVNAGELLPDDVEWPVGHVSGAVETESGHIVVRANAAGRVQVYDQDLNFVTGWHVNGDGGTMWLVAPSGQGDVVDVYAVRLRERSRYALDGTLLAQEPYVQSDIDETDKGNVRVAIPTSWWRYPLVSPAWGLLFMVPGILAQTLITRRFGVTLPFGRGHVARS